MAFSVEPSQSPSGILTPSVVIPSATTCVRSAISRPSSIITASRTSSSRRPISSPSAVRVRSMNISETAVFPVELADLLDLAADRLADPGELARRDAGEHPVHHRPRQRVAVGEVLVALNRQLALVVGRAHPRATDRDPPAAQGHRPVLVAVTDRDAIGVVLALRADDLVDLELHQLVHDAEPDADAEREQALPRCPDELAQRLLDPRWERTLRRLAGSCRPRWQVPSSRRFLLSRWTSDARHGHNTTGQGGRTAIQSSTRSRTTSGSGSRNLDSGQFATDLRPRRGAR